MTKERNSSVEIYRILAVFSVLIVHYNGWFLGGMPESFDFSNPTAHRIGQVIIEAMTICCINCFLLISGFFGIRLRLQSVVKFIVLLLGVYIPFWLFDCWVGHGTLSFSAFIDQCKVITRGGYFVQCYFMLMLLSPILNAFVEKMGKKMLPLVLIIIGMELWFDCITKEKTWIGFEQGYSVQHFCLVYLIGRAICLYQDVLTKRSRWLWVALYFFFAAVIAVLYLLKVRFAFYYSNPLVILTAICSFLPFIYHHRVNKTINWIASGTFAVYLIQVIEPVFSFLCQTDQRLLAENSYPLYLLKSAVLMVAFFLLCVLYDKLREWCSAPLLRILSTPTENRTRN